MKIRLLFSAFVWLSFLQIVAAQTIAVSGCNEPGSFQIVNGFYNSTGIVDGRHGFSANRGDSYCYCQPQILAWNSASSQWEIKVGSGIYAHVVAYNSTDAGPLPPETGWILSQAGGYACGNSAVLTVYAPITQTPVCDNCNWSDPATWASGFLPRRYDDVTITDALISLDQDAVCNNLTVTGSQGGVLSRGGTGQDKFRLSVLGSVTTESNSYIGVEELELSGSTPQSLGASYTGLKLTINNPAGVSMLKPIRMNVGGAVNFVKGNLFLGDNNLETYSATGASASQFVVTDGTGSLLMPFISGNGYDKFFPVGASASAYTPVNVKCTNGPIYVIGGYGYMGIKASSSFTYPTPTTSGVNTEWTFSYVYNNPYMSAPLYTLDFFWNEAQQSGTFDPAANVVARRYNGTAWVSQGAEGPVTASGNQSSFRVTNVYQFSPWTIFNSAPLPVVLKYFKADVTGDKNVVLRWETTSELDADFFDVERSADSKTFKKIGQIRAKGTSADVNFYQMADENPIRGIGYYRLKQVDTDGTFHYYRTVSARTEGSSSPYPNPSDGKFLILDVPVTSAIVLLNVKGEDVPFDRKKLSELSVQLLPKTTLSPGLYVVTVNGVSRKWVVQ
jgi:hypothetical protein